MTKTEATVLIKSIGQSLRPILGRFADRIAKLETENAALKEQVNNIANIAQGHARHLQNLEAKMKKHNMTVIK